MSNIFQWNLHGDGKTLLPGESWTTINKHVFKADEVTPGTETETRAGSAGTADGPSSARRSRARASAMRAIWAVWAV